MVFKSLEAARSREVYSRTSERALLLNNGLSDDFQPCFLSCIVLANEWWGVQRWKRLFVTNIPLTLAANGGFSSFLLARLVPIYEIQTKSAIQDGMGVHRETARNGTCESLPCVEYKDGELAQIDHFSLLGYEEHSIA